MNGKSHCGKWGSQAEKERLVRECGKAENIRFLGKSVKYSVKYFLTGKQGRLRRLQPSNHRVETRRSSSCTSAQRCRIRLYLAIASCISARRPSATSSNKSRLLENGSKNASFGSQWSRISFQGNSRLLNPASSHTSSSSTAWLARKRWLPLSTPDCWIRSSSSERVLCAITAPRSIGSIAVAINQQEEQIHHSPALLRSPFSIAQNLSPDLPLPFVLDGR